MQKLKEKPDSESGIIPDGLMFVPPDAQIPSVRGNVQIRSIQGLTDKDRMIFPKEKVLFETQFALGFVSTEVSGS